MLAEILLGAEASRTTRELFNSGSTVCRAYPAGQDGSRRPRSILIALRYDRSRALPGSRKINSKVKGSGQECPLHTSGGACSADSRGRRFPHEPCPHEL